MSDFKTRLQAEQSELQEKLDKLKGFIGTENFLSISREQQALLNIQSASMETYSKCLEERIKNLEG